MLRRVLPLCLTGVLVACGGSATSGTATPTTSAGATETPSAGATEATSAPTSAAPTPANSSPAPTAPSDVAVPAALQFSAPLVGGGEIELDAYAGRPVLLWFWAPW